MTRQMEITSKLKGQNVKVGIMRTGARLRKSGWKCERPNMIGQNDLRDRWKNKMNEADRRVKRKSNKEPDLIDFALQYIPGE
jgi:hypothetical protein